MATGSRAVRLAILLVLGISGTSHAEIVTAEGTITTVDTKTRSISVSRATSAGQKSGNFRVAPDAKILLNGTATNLQALATNQKVTLTYDTDLGAVTKIEAFGSATDGGYVAIFDGLSLSSWETHRPDVWSVQDGSIVGQCRFVRKRPVEPTYLFYPVSFSDFELQAEVKINPTGNSGIFFRTTAKNGHPNGGYEVQIAGNSTTERFLTGSLFKIAAVPKRLTQDDTWFTVHIRAQGPQIAIRINNKTVVETVNRDFLTGGFGLQCMAKDGPAIVHFRNIKVRRL